MQESNKKLSKTEMAVVIGVAVVALALVIGGIVMIVVRGNERSGSIMFGNNNIEKMPGTAVDDTSEKTPEKTPAVVEPVEEDDDENWVFKDKENYFDLTTCKEKIAQDNSVSIPLETLKSLETLARNNEKLYHIYGTNNLPFEEGDSVYLKVKSNDYYNSYYKLAEDVSRTYTEDYYYNMTSRSSALYKSGDNGSILFNTASPHANYGTTFSDKRIGEVAVVLMQFDGKVAVLKTLSYYSINPELPDLAEGNTAGVKIIVKAKEEAAGRWRIYESSEGCVLTDKQ